MLTMLLAFCIGIVAGLRAMTAPTMVSWAARLKMLALAGSWLAFLGSAWTPWILTIAALGEFMNDKLPQTPSRTTTLQFGVRILTGGISGAAIGYSAGFTVVSAIAGALGAIAGTFGGAELRISLVKAAGGRDMPIALAEDSVAITFGLLLILFLP
jgi:uncharacterized membrane protein